MAYRSFHIPTEAKRFLAGEPMSEADKYTLLHVLADTYTRAQAQKDPAVRELERMFRLRDPRT